jgi:fatty-acid desaturase
MIKFRILFSLGFIGLLVGIIDTIINTHYWLLFSYVYNFLIVSWVGIAIGLHRYICHRSFNTTKIKHWLLCASSILPGYGSPVTFTMLHRHHHKHADTELDTHNPEHGFWHSWLLYGTYKINWYRQVKQVTQFPKDIMRDPAIKFFHDHYYKLMYMFIIVTLIINWRVGVYFVLCPFAFSMLHNFFFSWTSHIPRFPGNYRTFNTNDQSQNNRFVGLMICELHNNHHDNPKLYNEAINPGEIDPSGWLIEHLFIEHNPEKQYRF